MYRRHVAAVHPPEEASLCLRWGCIQEQPTATSIPLIPFSFSPFFFPPLPSFRSMILNFIFEEIWEIYTRSMSRILNFSKIQSFSPLFFPLAQVAKQRTNKFFHGTTSEKFTRWLRIIFASENICFCVNVSLDDRLSRTLEERSSLLRAGAR